MATEPEGSRGTARTAAPKLRELLGDFSAIPLFADMATACERATIAGTLAWPMPLPFPARPPEPPHFAPLGALFCNHLGHLLIRGAEVDDADGVPGGCAALLAFFGEAAARHAAAVPPALRARYAGDVLDRVAAAMRVMRPDEGYWQRVHAEARKRGEIQAGGMDEGLLELPTLAACGEDAQNAAWRLYARFEAATR